MTSASTLVSVGYRLDRRKFLGGAWLCRRHDGEGQPAARPVEVASILVHARPERLAEVEQAIAALGGINIRSRNPIGRLMVAVEATHPGAIGAALNTIVTVPGVLTAALASSGPAVAILS